VYAVIRSMHGEFLTRLTVWIALSGYAAGLLLFWFGRGRDYYDSLARIFWTFGCAALLAHIAAAFQFYHGWSHTAAYAETALQTSRVYGLNWGGGLYINYILMIGWIADVFWWWRGIDQYRNRARVITLIWHAFLFFIFFNATVVFARGMIRWVGLSFTATILIAWIYQTTKKSHQNSVDVS
jgi:hypothetical protein